MRRLLVLVLAIVALTIVMPGTVLAGPPLHQATGGGVLQLSGGLVTYGFTAIQLDTAENAKGEFRFLTRVSSRTFQAEVQYLAVDAVTGDAWIGAVITQGDEGMGEGTGVVFRVRDNGEGNGASKPDMVSSVWSNVDPAWALCRPCLGLKPLTHGNIQVK